MQQNCALLDPNDTSSQEYLYSNSKMNPVNILSQSKRRV